MNYTDETGKPAGFVVDALNEAARRDGLRLQWVPAGDAATNDRALLKGELDLIGGTSTAQRKRTFYVSEPWWSSDMVALTRASSPLVRDSDLTGRRIAAPASAVDLVMEHYRTRSVVARRSAVEAAEAACTGEAEAAVIASMFLRELMFANPAGCRGVQVRTIESEAEVDYVLVARREEARAAAGLRKRLNDITADGTLAAIAARYPPVSTPQATRMAELLRLEYKQRLWRIMVFAAAAVILLTVLFLHRQHRSRNQLSAANAQLRRDLQARVEAETAMRNSEARFRALLDSAPQTVIAMGAGGQIAFANAKAEEMFGYSREELLGAAPECLLDGAPAQAEDGPFRLAGGERGKFAQVVARRKNGQGFPAEVTLRRVEAGEDLTLAFVHDVSERVDLERQLRQSQKLESIGQLAGGVAHDFNNLLTVITSYADMALHGTPGQGFREPLEQILYAADRAAALTRQLLMFSRREVGSPRILSINELIRNLDKMLRRLIGENIELVLAADPDAGSVRADPSHLEQVILNLAVNARDAMPLNGKLEIATGTVSVSGNQASGRPSMAAGDYVILRVRDNGCGMREEVKSHIFEPFFTTKEQGKGTGLGLSTTYGIVRQAGGAIFVESEPGRGTTFEILLPAVEPGAADKTEADVEREAPAGAGTVLVVEDEDAVRKLIQAVLETHGYTVLSASNGREALRVAEENADRIDLLLSDVVMPEMGGIDLAERFAELHPRIKVAHMSGYADGQQPLKRCAPLLHKPFTPAVLLKYVAELVGGGRGAVS